MNNVILLIGVFLATLGLIQTSSGLTLGMSSEKILETQQLILLGTVDLVEARSGDTEYTVTVLEYVKTPSGFNKVDTIHVVGCGEGQVGGCITFDKGQDVLFILNERNDTLLVSELSFVSPNPNCTIDDIFRYNDEKYGGLSVYQDSENNRYLYTNQPITAQYYYFNKNLEATSVDVTITVIDDFPDILKEETIHLELDECQPNAKVEMEFVIDSPGSFAVSAKVEGNGGGESFGGVKVIDYVAPPLKQSKSGIPFNEIQCKEGLELILKSSDGSPGCVKPETKQKLIERGWASTNTQKPIGIVSSQSELAIFYAQPQLTSVILPNDDTIRIHLFSYMRDSSGNWNQIFDSAFDEVPKNFMIGIVEQSPDKTKEFAISGKENLPHGIKAKLSREGGYFVVYITSDKSLSLGKYDLSVVSADKTGLIIEKPLQVIAVKKTSTTIQDHIIRIDYGKGNWGIIFENIPEQEYWIREERRDPWPPMPILNITDDNIHPSVKELIEAMWEPEGKYIPYEYDDNVLLKNSNRTLNLDPPKIKDWLKKVHDEQFGRNLDDSYSSYIRYDDKIYSFGFVVSD